MGEAPVTEQGRCCDHDWTGRSADRSDECVRVENTVATGRIEMAQNGSVECPNRACRNPPKGQHQGGTPNASAAIATPTTTTTLHRNVRSMSVRPAASPVTRTAQMKPAVPAVATNPSSDSETVKDS